MTIKEMQELRRQLGYSYEMVAKLSGVPLGTVQKVLLGITKCPRYDTLSALEDVFRPKYESMIRETSAYNASSLREEVTVEDKLEYLNQYITSHKKFSFRDLLKKQKSHQI